MRSYFIRGGSAVAVIFIALVGLHSGAWAQADPNLQNQLDAAIPRQEFPSAFAAFVETVKEHKPGESENDKYLKAPYPCMSDGDFIRHYFHGPDGGSIFGTMTKERLDELLKSKAETDYYLQLILHRPALLNRGRVAWDKDYANARLGHGRFANRNLPSLPPSFCRLEQKPSIKLTMPFNPTEDSNALKSDIGAHADRTIGIGGTVQGVEGGFRSFDLIGVSVGTTSLRYEKFHAKDTDAFTVQAAYQFFLSATGYHEDGTSLPIDEALYKSDSFNAVIPAPNMITYATLQVGFQNQRAYAPFYAAEKSDMFTPQFTLAEQNISLLDPKGNVCEPGSLDYRKIGFCYYADLSLNGGQTFSDQVTQQNANVSLSATVGRRFDKSDWKLSLQAAATERGFEDVDGGRNDVLLQVGPALAYAAPSVVTPWGTGSLSINLPVNFYDNISTVSKNSYREIVVMPSFSFAFAPEAKLGQGS